MRRARIRAVRVHRVMPVGERVEVRKREGWAAVHDSVKIVFNDRVVTGMVVAVNRLKLGWFTQMQLCTYLIQIEPESEDGHTTCICIPTVEDSGPSPLCGALHAEYADFEEET